MTISIIETKTLTDQAEAYILEYIEKNHLVPGDTLPNERQFSETLGVSRNVIREAMSRLRMLGLLHSRTKKGIRLKEPPLFVGFERVTNPRLLSVQTVKKLMGMRIALEIGITDFIFESITDKDIQDLNNILIKSQTPADTPMMVESEKTFHSKIYNITGNDFIAQFQEILHPIFAFTNANYEKILKPIDTELKKSNQSVSHHDLLTLLEKRDKEGYRIAIKNHLKPYWIFIMEGNK